MTQCRSLLRQLDWASNLTHEPSLTPPLLSGRRQVCAFDRGRGAAAQFEAGERGQTTTSPPYRIQVCGWGGGWAICCTVYAGSGPSFVISGCPKCLLKCILTSCTAGSDLMPVSYHCDRDMRLRVTPAGVLVFRRADEVSGGPANPDKCGMLSTLM